MLGEVGSHPESGVLVLRINQSPQNSRKGAPIGRQPHHLVYRASTKGAGEPKKVGAIRRGRRASFFHQGTEGRPFLLGGGHSCWGAGPVPRPGHGVPNPALRDEVPRPSPIRWIGVSPTNRCRAGYISRVCDPESMDGTAPSERPGSQGAQSASPHHARLAYSTIFLTRIRTSCLSFMHISFGVLRMTTMLRPCSPFSSKSITRWASGSHRPLPLRL